MFKATETSSNCGHSNGYTIQPYKQSKRTDLVELKRYAAEDSLNHVSLTNFIIVYMNSNACKDTCHLQYIQ